MKQKLEANNQSEGENEKTDATFTRDVSNIDSTPQFKQLIEVSYLVFHFLVKCVFKLNIFIYKYRNMRKKCVLLSVNVRNWNTMLVFYNWTYRAGAFSHYLPFAFFSFLLFSYLYHCFCAFKRPEMKELRECQSQLKKYEKLVKKHNLL